MSRSSTVEMVILLAAERDCSDLIAVHAGHAREGDGELSDIEWCNEEINAAGLSELLDLEGDSWKDCPPGLWRVGGHFWAETYHSPNYGVDYDGGFEVEHAEPLNLNALVEDWVASPGDRAFLAALCADAREQVRVMMMDRGGAVAAVLAVLQVVVEDEHVIK